MNFDPEMLRAILQGGAQSGQLDPQIEKLKAQAAMLRQGTGNTQGKMIGKMYVGPTPFEHAANAFSGYMGGKKADEATGMQQEQAGIRGRQNDKVLEALIKQMEMRQAQQQTQAGQPPYIPGRHPSTVGMGY